MNNSNFRIPLLWIMLMVGLTIHTSMDLLPLFCGGSVVMENATGEVPAWMAILMSTFTYTVPFIGLLFSIYGKKRCDVIVGLAIACLMALFHILHMAELFMGAGMAQFFIMPLNAVIAVLLVIALWNKQKSMKKGE